MQDTLGDRMKDYEKNFSLEKLLPKLPVMIRLDGVAFHTFTKGLNRPYDARLSDLMVKTTRYLTKLTNAKIGYTQSDEISLLLQASRDEQLYFDGKKSKILSILASRCTLYFNSLLKEMIPEKAEAEPVFDCRIWNLPTKEEAANAFVWREKDATRNSISMAAQSLYSHKELHKKTSSEKQEMLHQKGVNWNNYPSFFKRGTYIQKKIIERPFTTDEMALLPVKHAARNNPELTVKRTDYLTLDNLPPITKIINRVEVLFDGEEAKILEPNNV